jgi:hypothetical protein
MRSGLGSVRSTLRGYGLAVAAGTALVMAVSGATAGAAGAYSAAWDGTAWSVQAILPIPQGAAADAVLGLACTSATSCTAVGQTTGAAPYGGQTLAEAWDGTAWSIQTTPSPAASSNELLGVSCVAGGPCVAVGEAPDAGKYETTLAESTG